MRKSLVASCAFAKFLVGTAPAMAAGTCDGRICAEPSAWFVYGVIVLVLLGSIIALFLIRAAVEQSKWSLSDSLSEDTEITSTLINANGQSEPRLDSTGKPLMVREMRASSSRLIALMGMMAILVMFIGFGAFALYQFGATGKMPDDIDKVVQFLAAGMTLFAPYVVNKFSSLFEGLAPKR